MDNVIVAALGGTAGLGAYALAFTIANLVPNFLGDTIVRVHLPLVAAVRDSRDALAAGVRRALYAVVAALAPTALGLGLFRPDARGRRFRPGDRKNVVQGKRGDLGGRRFI